MSGEPVIATEALTKRFGRITAVDEVDLDVREGDVYGFLGANGSGKTTTVRMLLGLVLATSGRMEVLGRPMPSGWREVLPQVGAMVEGPAAYVFPASDPRLSAQAELLRVLQKQAVEISRATAAFTVTIPARRPATGAGGGGRGRGGGWCW